MHPQKWPLFLPETREENPLFGVHTKNAGVFVIFCTIKCCHRTDQKVSSLRKLDSMGNQLHHCNNLQLVQNCFCRIFWLTFFVCLVSAKKSGDFCASTRKSNVCYTRGTRWFSLVFLCPRFARAQLQLVRIILFLPCSINIYYTLIQGDVQYYYLRPCMTCPIPTLPTHFFRPSHLHINWDIELKL